jgi:hypothetical protein
LSSHDASGQFVGYLYQAYSALILLLNEEEQTSQICIEKFDDISFMQDDIPATLIQTKHQIFNIGNLNNTSIDLWRTINNWCDAITNFDPKTLRDTKFHLLTTAIAANDTAAYYLKENGRNTNKAQEILENVAVVDAQKTNSSFYCAFLALSSERRKQLVENIVIYDQSIHIENAQSKILHSIQWATLPKFEKHVFQRLVGWWFEQIIICLCAKTPVFISKSQLRSKIYDISGGYKNDSLPIDVDALEFPSENEVSALSDGEKVFIKQLKIISLSNDRIQRAIRDFYRAYQQRSQWVREELLYIDELENYERILVDAWHRMFLIMKDNLEDYKDKITEAQKNAEGRGLFNAVEDLNLYIRERVTQPFIMRGTYHGLANSYKVGWHIDFIQRLKSIVEG